MINNLLLETVVVFCIFLGILFSLGALIRIIARLSTSSPIRSVALSIGTGLIFGLGSFGLINFSNKFAEWTVGAKIKYSGQIFIIVFICVLMIMFVSTNIKKES
jgi:hypothetical protein